MPVDAGDVAWRDVRAQMRAFIARRVDDPHAADDLVQEVLARLHEHLDHLDDRDRLVPFAYRVTRNVIVDHYRARASAKEVAEDHERVAARADALLRDQADEPGEEDRAALARCLRPLVERLPEPYRGALLATDLGPLSQAEAARRAGLSAPGMKARVQRGRGKLAALLAECCTAELDVRGGVVGHRRVGRCDCSSAQASAR